MFQTYHSKFITRHTRTHCYLIFQYEKESLKLKEEARTKLPHHLTARPPTPPEKHIHVWYPSTFLPSYLPPFLPSCLPSFTLFMCLAHRSAPLPQFQRRLRPSSVGVQLTQIFSWKRPTRCIMGGVVFSRSWAGLCTHAAEATPSCLSANHRLSAECGGGGKQSELRGCGVK